VSRQIGDYHRSFLTVKGRVFYFRARSRPRSCAAVALFAPTQPFVNIFIFSPTFSPTFRPAARFAVHAPPGPTIRFQYRVSRRRRSGVFKAYYPAAGLRDGAGAAEEVEGQILAAGKAAQWFALRARSAFMSALKC
jgi:hypothetical protein